MQSFRPCPSGAPSVWVTDGTGERLFDLVRELSFGADAPVYAEILATRIPAPDAAISAGYPDAIRVEAVRRAYPAGEGPDCDEDLRFLAYRAFGNEPFWNLSVSVDGALLSVLGEDPSLRFTTLEADSLGGGVHTIRARAATADGDRLLVRLEAGRCVDSMSGARFSLRARVEVGTRVLRGCALHGDAELPAPQ